MTEKTTKRLEDLFKDEPDRLSRLTFDVAGIYFDFSKTHLDRDVIKRALQRAGTMDFAKARESLFTGGIVNPSEDRPATHVAERGSGSPAGVEAKAAANP